MDWGTRARWVARRFKNDIALENSMQHKPVLFEEALAGLKLEAGGVFIDATFGRGGHSAGIVKQLKSHDRLIVIDQDPQAIAFAKEKFVAQSKVPVSIHHASFTALKKIAEKENVMGKVSGILFDLGVSSPQIDQAERGFSFMHDGPLDMRMNNSQGITAEEWLAEVPEEALALVIREFGEEKFAKRIAKAVVMERQKVPIKSTKQLALIIANAVPKKEMHKHPATRTFQAIRLYVNQELQAIREALQQSLDVLCVGGRLVVISFHSLEDRIVKQFMRGYVKGVKLPKEIPVIGQAVGQRLMEIGKAVKASDAEVQGNVRARSAVLRITEKIA